MSDTKSTKSTNRWKITDEDLIADLKRVHTQQGRISVAVYDEFGNHSAGTVIRHFGKWSDGVTAAGLPAAATGRRTGSFNVSTQDLLAHVDSVLGESESIPVRAYDAASEYSSVTVIRRFGSWKNAIEARRKYAAIVKSVSGGDSTQEEVMKATGCSQDEILDIFTSWDNLFSLSGKDTAEDGDDKKEN